MKKIFSSPLYWQLFFSLENSMKNEAFDNMLSKLKEYFKYRENVIQYEYKGQF